MVPGSRAGRNIYEEIMSCIFAKSMALFHLVGNVFDLKKRFLTNLYAPKYFYLRSVVVYVDSTRNAGRNAIEVRRQVFRRTVVGLFTF